MTKVTYNRNYDRDGKGDTSKVVEHDNGSKTITQYKSRKFAPGMHWADGPKTVTKLDADGNEI